MNFDLDEWLASVEGHTVRVTRPDSPSAGVPGLLTRQAADRRDDRYCAACDAYVRDVKTSPDERIGHCPRCGRSPGLAELGTTRDRAL